MNERIKQLAGAALDKVVPYTWTTLDYNQILELLECHSQLVIKECASIVDNHGRWILYDKLAVKIKKHFGVEEC